MWATVLTRCEGGKFETEIYPYAEFREADDRMRILANRYYLRMTEDNTAIGYHFRNHEGTITVHIE